MTETTKRTFSIVGTVDPLEARTLRTGDVDSERVRSIRERLGVDAVEGAVLAVVVQRDSDTGVESALGFVDLGKNDLGTTLTPEKAQEFGLSPVDALIALRRANEAN